MKTLLVMILVLSTQVSFADRGGGSSGGGGDGSPEITYDSYRSTYTISCPGKGVFDCSDCKDAVSPDTGVAFPAMLEEICKSL